MTILSNSFLFSLLLVFRFLPSVEPGISYDWVDSVLWNLHENDALQRNPSEPNNLSVPFPGGRKSAGFTHIQGTRDLVLFGGIDFSASELDDTWLYHLDIFSWTKASPTFNPPGIQMIQLVSTKPLWSTFFGGMESGGIFVSTVWRYESTEPTWTQVPMLGISPNSRCSVALWPVKGPSGGIYVACGMSATGPFESCSDIFQGSFAVSETDGTWNMLTTSGSLPPELIGPATWVDFGGSRERLFLFGGDSVAGAAANLFIFDRETLQWSEDGASAVDFATNYGAGLPGVRTSMASASLGNYGIVYGGIGAARGASGALAELWMFEIETMTWRMALVNFTDRGMSGSYDPVFDESFGSPGQRYSHAMAVDETERKIYVFGGVWGMQIDPASDLWSLEIPSEVVLAETDSDVCNFVGIIDWQLHENSPDQRFVNANEDLTIPYPQSRVQHLFQHLPGTDLILLYGGSDVSTTLLGDTWTYDMMDSSWMKRFPSPTPGTRGSISSVGFDGGLAVFFGGMDPWSSLSDVWKWEIGQNWTEVVAAMPPVGRWGYSMWKMKDPKKGFHIACGFSTENFPCTPIDTFEFDGGDTGSWTARVVTAAPSQRRLAACWADYFGEKERLWLFGGVSSLGLYCDLYYIDVEDSGWVVVSDRGFSAPSDYSALLPRPGVRYSVAGVIGESAFLYGGLGFGNAADLDSGYLGDLFVFHLTDHSWKHAYVEDDCAFQQVDALGPRYVGAKRPGVRMGSPLAVVAGTREFYIFGGGVPGSAVRNDLWALNLAPVMCGDKLWNEGGACSGNGVCEGVDICVCNDPTRWTGPFCEFPVCNGVSLVNASSVVCAGRGTCDSPNSCTCRSFFWNANAFCATVQWQFLAGIAGAGSALVLCMILIGSVVCLIFCCRRCRRSPEVTSTRDSSDRGSKTTPKRESSRRRSKGKSLDDVVAAQFVQHKAMFKIEWEDVELVSQIAEGGGSAVVYEVVWEKSTCAFKVFQCQSLSHETDFTDFSRELEVMSSISHKNLLRFYGASLSLPRVGIVMEFCSNGDLHDYILTEREALPWKLKFQLMMGVTTGLAYLHNRGIVHRDLKCANVLLDDGFVPKLCDFGLSKIISRSEKALHTRRVGTMHYMAPEVTRGTKYGCPVDIFSLAIIFFEICFQTTRPYPAEEFQGLEFRVASDENYRPDLTRAIEFQKGVNLPSSLADFIRRMWSNDEDVRPKAGEVVDFLSQNESDLMAEMSG